MSKRNGTDLRFLGWERRLGGCWVLVCRARDRAACWGLLAERAAGAAVETSWRVLRAGTVPVEWRRKKGVRR